MGTKKLTSWPRLLYSTCLFKTLTLATYFEWYVLRLIFHTSVSSGKTFPSILTDLIFVCLFVYSRTSNLSAIWRLSPLPVTGLQILAYARRREGSLSCHTYCDTGPRFIRSRPKNRSWRTVALWFYISVSDHNATNPIMQKSCNLRRWFFCALWECILY
jgi:hypothetical protein